MDDARFFACINGEISSEVMLPLAVFLSVSLPWLNPFAPGPLPPTAQSLFTLVCAALLFWGLTSLQRQGEFSATTAGAWIAAALLSCAIGLLQYFGVGDTLSPWVSTTAPGEAFANLRQRNQFASLTNIGIAALLLWAVRHCVPGGGESAEGPAPARYGPLGASAAAASVTPRIVTTASAALLAIGNAASSSRTGLVQLVMLIVLVAWWGGLRRREVRVPLLAAVVAYALASALLPLLAGLDPATTGIMARLHDGGPACASRLTLWSNVLHLISLKPWLGWGWGELDFAHFTTLYSEPRFCEILDNAHNLPLHLAVELGLPAALLICGGGLWLVWRGKPWRERDATRQMAWSVLALIMLHSMLEYPLWYGPFQMAFGLCIGLLWQRSATASAVVEPAVAPAQATSGAAYTAMSASKSAATTFGGNTARPIKIVSNKPVAPVLCALLAIIIIFFVAYTAWDYHRVSQIYLPPEDRSPAYRSNTLAKIQGSWLFQNQVRFAELTTTRLTSDNSARLNAMALELLHFSPEARVAEKVIDSARLLGRFDEAQYFEARYLAAFPQEHAKWAKASAAKQ